MLLNQNGPKYNNLEASAKYNKTRCTILHDDDTNGIKGKAV